MNLIESLQKSNRVVVKEQLTAAHNVIQMPSFRADKDASERQEGQRIWG